MDLLEAMRTTGTCRYFENTGVPDSVLFQAFEAARFGKRRRSKR